MIISNNEEESSIDFTVIGKVVLCIIRKIWVFFMIIGIYYFCDTFSTFYCNIFLRAVTKFIDNKSENAVGLETQVRPLPS